MVGESIASDWELYPAPLSSWTATVSIRTVWRQEFTQLSYWALNPTWMYEHLCNWRRNYASAHMSQYIAGIKPIHIALQPGSTTLSECMIPICVLLSCCGHYVVDQWLDATEPHSTDAERYLVITLRNYMLSALKRIATETKD